MMHKRKKYLLVSLPIIICILMILNRVSIWDDYARSMIRKKIDSYGWSFKAQNISGNVFGTIIMDDIEFIHKDVDQYINFTNCSEIYKWLWNRGTERSRWEPAWMAARVSMKVCGAICSAYTIT